MTNTPSLSSLVASNFMRIKLTETSIPFSKAYKAGKTIVASHDNAAESSYRVTRSLFPPGYDAQLTTLRKAMTAARKLFNEHTVHAGKGADGVTNQGDKWIRSKLIADGSFLAAWQTAYGEFVQARDAFVTAYPVLIQAIETDSQYGRALGDSFDSNDYPFADTIKDGFALALDGPYPIADASAYGTMPLDAETRETLEARYEASQRRAMGVVTQNLASDMAKYLQVMAKNLTSLKAYQETPLNGKGKRTPPVYESMVTNITEALDRAKSFAVPDTDQGARLLELVEQIEASLEPDRLDAEYLKGSPPSYVGQLAETAKGLAEALSATDWD